MKMLKILSIGCLLALLAGGPVAAQSTGYLKTKVKPGRAGVFVDGKYIGPAANFGSSRKYALAPGEHEIRLVEPRYEAMTTKVRIEAGKTATLKQELKAVELAKPPFGTLRVIHPDKYAAVYINTHFAGHADEFNNFAQGLLLNPGEYEVKVEPVSGGQGIARKVTITAGQTTLLQ